ncbi:hypothetical protein BH09ACT7_BH09ACT7_07320 [soil metagenome]
MRTLLMQPTAAALCAVCIAAPVALPSGNSVASAPGRDLEVSAPAVLLAAATTARSTALPATPTLLEVLGLQIQTANNILEAGTTGAQALPPGFSLTAAQYVSVFNAVNAYIKVGSTVAAQLVNGQFEQIAPSFQANLTAANTALQGLPPSIAASLQYDLGVIQAFFATLGVGGVTSASDADATVEAKTVASSAVSTVLPAAPTLLEVLGLQIQTANNIIEAGTTGAQALPPGFPLTAAQYVSVFNVLNAFIKVGSTVAAQVVNGQFQQIAPSFQANLTAANAALHGFAPSVAASLQYDLGVIQNFFAPPVAKEAGVATKALAVSDVTANALPADPTLLEVLGLQIQTANNILEAGTTGAQALPPGFPVAAAQYVSVFNAVNAYIKVGSTVAAQLVNGQFEQIAPSFQTNLTTANTTLQGLAPSIAASLQYDAAVVGNFVSGGATNAKASTVSTADATPAALPSALKADATDKTTDTAALPKAAPVAGVKKAPKDGFLKQLQSAVDQEVGGGKVKVAPAGTGTDAGSDSDSPAPKPAKHSDAKKTSGSAKSTAGASAE